MVPSRCVHWQAQLNYYSPRLRSKMLDILARISGMVWLCVRVCLHAYVCCVVLLCLMLCVGYVLASLAV